MMGFVFMTAILPNAATCCQADLASHVAPRYNAPMPETLTTAEAAKLLGVCTRTVQRWIWAGRLPKLRMVGRVHLLRKVDVVRFGKKRKG